MNGTSADTSPPSSSDGAGDPQPLSSTQTVLHPSRSTIPTTTYQYIPDEYEVEDRLILVPALTIALIIGIVANVLAIVATYRASKIYRRSSSRMNIASVLIKLLMVVDLTAVSFFFLRGMFYSVYDGTAYKCDLDTTTNLFFTWASGFINALMCFERCVALTAPFYYHSNASVGKAKVAVVVLLVIAALISMMPVFGFGAYKTMINGTYYCIGPGDFKVNETKYDFEFAVVYLSTGMGIMIFIHVCNAIVIRQIIKIRMRSAPRIRSRKAEAAVVAAAMRESMRVSTLMKDSSTSFMFGNCDQTTSSHSSDGGNYGGESTGSSSERRSTSTSTSRHRRKIKPPGRTEVNVAKMIILVSLVFTISWLPFYIQRLLKALDISQPRWFLHVVVFLLVSNHVIDPFVFVFMKRQSRGALKDLFAKGVCCKKCCPPSKVGVNDTPSRGSEGKPVPPTTNKMSMMIGVSHV